MTYTYTFEALDDRVGIRDYNLTTYSIHNAPLAYRTLNPVLHTDITDTSEPTTPVYIPTKSSTRPAEIDTTTVTHRPVLSTTPTSIPQISTPTNPPKSIAPSIITRPSTTKTMTDIPAPLLQALRLLIRANHILHQHHLVDAFGHISLRHPLAPDQYLIAAYDPGAPALVRSQQDFISYRVRDSTPVDPNAPQGYSERFIHGEILRRFPDINCVVHSHSETVIPFTLANIPVRPVFHMAGFLGASSKGIPVFDAQDAYRDLVGKVEITPDMLIKNQPLGKALARKLHLSTPVVLQHKHGFTCMGKTVEEAVYRALYTQTNCELLSKALRFTGGDVDRVSYLSEEETKSCKKMNEKCVDKSWRLWLREVQTNPLYENEEGEPEALAVSGMKV
ncbi:arad-like aldolase/epimerase [Macroventuria anomochaeta]|uniref:Arad-like aldolase/epimerase n=1 Tax=Macroventuria anomochaeta TaxID=301207 RepID=A0ACB6S513_9PLEO|nr:arad-like aldolase/epimerase [Macroventuria anomochaeta]KAF2628602.1 arad-like aldolase/epimerase [Macroventuria anomochaeta]